MGLDISLSNLPGTPQCEKCDFFMVRMNLPTSIGLVFKKVKEGTPSSKSRLGAGSL